MTRRPVRASWTSAVAQSTLGVDSWRGDGQWDSKRLTIPGTKATGSFPASEATPSSAESQGRTFREGLTPPLPEPVPWKQPDLAMGVSQCPPCQGPL